MIENDELIKIINILIKYEKDLIDIKMYKNIIFLEDFNNKYKNIQNDDLIKIMLQIKTDVIKTLKKLIKLQNIRVKQNQLIYYTNNLFNEKDEEIENWFKLNKITYPILNQSIRFLDQKLKYALLNKQKSYEENKFSEIYLYIILIKNLYAIFNQKYTNLTIIQNCKEKGIETNIEVNLDIPKYIQDLKEIKTLIYKIN